MGYGIFWFMLGVVVVAHFAFVCTVTVLLAAKAVGWLWDRVWKE